MSNWLFMSRKIDDIIDDIRYNPSDISEQEELDDDGEYYNWERGSKMSKWLNIKTKKQNEKCI